MQCDFSWNNVNKWLFSPEGTEKRQETEGVTPTLAKSSLLNQYIYWDYLQEHRGGVGSKPSTSQKAHPSTGDDTQKLHLWSALPHLQAAQPTGIPFSAVMDCFVYPEEGPHGSSSFPELAEPWSLP